MKRLITVIAAISLLAMNVSANDEGWNFSFTPYLWVAGVSGDVGIGPIEAEVDSSFSDVLDNLEIGFLGHFEASNNQWSAFGDLTYLELGKGLGDFDSDITEVILEGGVGYRVSPIFEVIGGGRYWSLDTKLARTVAPRVAVESDQDWFDPFLGGRLRLPVSEAFSVGVRGDLGGVVFGSDFSWNMQAHIDWRVAKSVSIIVGYKALAVDYQNDGDDNEASFKFDAITHGPVLAASFRF